MSAGQKKLDVKLKAQPKECSRLKKFIVICGAKVTLHNKILALQVPFM